jgi:hypothetical protein
VRLSRHLTAPAACIRRNLVWKRARCSLQKSEGASMDRIAASPTVGVTACRRFDFPARRLWLRTAAQRLRPEPVTPLSLPPNKLVSPVSSQERNTPEISRTRLLAIVKTVVAVLIACDPQLLPLVPAVDAPGIDVLVSPLGSQAVATLLWMRMRAAGALRVARLTVGSAIADSGRSYLRQLQVGEERGTLLSERVHRKTKGAARSRPTLSDASKVVQWLFDHSGKAIRPVAVALGLHQPTNWDK